MNMRQIYRLRKKGTFPHTIFGPCLLWPRSPILATAELLSEVWAKYIAVGLEGEKVRGRV